jgi:hypothetical protein
MKIPGQLGKQTVNLGLLTPRRPLGSPLKIAHSATRDSSGQPASSLRITQAQIDRSRPFLSYLDLSRPKSNSRHVPGQLSKEKVKFRSEELRILSMSNCYPEKFLSLAVSSSVYSVYSVVELPSLPLSQIKNKNQKPPCSL